MRPSRCRVQVSDDPILPTQGPLQVWDGSASRQCPSGAAMGRRGHFSSAVISGTRHPLGTVQIAVLVASNGQPVPKANRAPRPDT